MLPILFKNSNIQELKTWGSRKPSPRPWLESLSRQNNLPNLQKKVRSMKKVKQALISFLREWKKARREKVINEIAQAFYLSGRSPFEVKEQYRKSKRMNNLSFREFELRFFDLVQVIEKINRKKDPAKCITFTFRHTDQTGKMTMTYPFEGEGGRARAMRVFEHLTDSPSVTSLSSHIERRPWTVDWGFDHEATAKIALIRRRLRKAAFSNR